MKTNLSSRSLDDCTFNEDESVADEKHCVNKDPFKAAHDCYENEILNPKLYGETSSILRYKRGVVLVLCAIGISILVGFLIAVVNRPKTVAMLDRSTVVFLIPPPDNIQQICNKDAIAVNLYQSRLKCLEACAPSECCNYPSELDLSCLKGNEVICRIYNSWCGNLSSNATVQFDAVLPPVSSSIARWCDETLVEVSNGQACKKACLPAQCCYFPGELPQSCFNGQAAVCEEYIKYCSVLDNPYAQVAHDHSVRKNLPGSL